MQYWTKKQVANIYEINYDLFLSRLKGKWSGFPAPVKRINNVNHYSITRVMDFIENAIENEKRKEERRYTKQDNKIKSKKFFNGQKFLKVKIDWSNLDMRISHDGTVTHIYGKNNTRQSFKRTA